MLNKYKRIQTRTIFFVIFVSFIGTASPVFCDEDPLFEKSTLVVGDQHRKPVANNVYTSVIQSFGNFSVTSDEDSVSIRNKETGKESSVQHESGRKWVLVKTHKGVAYFAALPSDNSDKNDVARIRRLDLENAAWLDELKFEFDENLYSEIAGTYVDDDYFIVVVALMKEKDSFSNSPESFWVGCFETGKSKTHWAEFFAAKKTRSRPGVYLWSNSNPDYADAGLRVFSRFEDRLLFCPEGKQSIRCLNIDTGTELWACDRVWEFQRGFIGPSVWQHYIGRFRVNEDFGLDEDEERAKKKFDTNFECSIIGGPAIVKLTENGDSWRGGHSIFVAVSKQPKVGLGGYLGESIVYELSDDGKIISTTNLPRLVKGSNFQVDETGVVWKCQADQLVRLEASGDSGGIGMGPGGFDCQTSVPWVRTISGQSGLNDVWLSAGTACDSTVMLKRFAMGVTKGGFIKEKGDALYQFPISVTDLQSGAQKNLLLKVPFSDPISAPRQNYSSNGDSYQTRGAYKLAITSFSLTDDRLQIVLGSHGTAQNLEFEFQRQDLFELFELKSEITSKAEVELPEDLTLMDVAKDPNSKRIEMLLARGANVDYRSKNGWSALMSAACYGCLDTVEVLINNGANVDFADKNCGGQTTLMWAARSGRSAKQKVELLTEAGADIWKKTDSGSDLLMSAAGAGNVEVVELLLEKGMKPNATNENGYTALMAAANDGNSKIIKLLIKAGATVNAVDTQKRTALMYAADGYDEGETIMALLEFGADPNLKDAEGRLAIDRCTDSNHGGAEQRRKILLEAMKAKK